MWKRGAIEREMRMWKAGKGKTGGGGPERKAESGKLKCGKREAENGTWPDALCLVKSGRGRRGWLAGSLGARARGRRRARRRSGAAGRSPAPRSRGGASARPPARPRECRLGCSGCGCRSRSCLSRGCGGWASPVPASTPPPDHPTHRTLVTEFLRVDLWVLANVGHLPRGGHPDRVLPRRRKADSASWR